ncbi:Bacterial regulatory protein, luxR family [Klebsiella electrica]|uniref:helix-turn-helix transcriptional regulator n=1 Tax=Klebsiella electrica TaxID=1259973 RepID=UPI00114D81EB|nr:LuxR C-terminal-related transcriptional regulator [Klebsiella electrica]QDI07822.1 Bacterial regulatory protein, luxR family [Klebsiella electrica]
MRKISIAIISRNTFLKASLMAIVNDLTRTRDDLTIRFSGHSSELSAADIIIAEILPGEIHLCNTSIKNRKQNSSVIILHSYDELPEKTRIVNCLKDVTFVPVKAVNIDSMREIIARALKKNEQPESKRAVDSASICANCPHKSLSPSQVVVAHGLMNGFDIGKISALHQISPKTVIYHKNQIMEKYGLNNHHDFFQFISVLKERG